MKEINIFDLYRVINEMTCNLLIKSPGISILVFGFDRSKKCRYLFYKMALLSDTIL